MEDDIFLNSKYGFCKFEENYRKLHIKENCENLGTCTTSHRFGHDCAYFHPKSVKTNKTNSGLEIKLQIMEQKNKEAMAFTINRLEDLVTDLIRQKNVSNLIDHEEEAVFTEEEKSYKN